MRQEAGQNDSGKQRKPTRTFEGFPNLQSNVCFTPNQFFDVVLPYSSRGVVRLVSYIIRMTLGWTDRDGNPKDDVYVSWTELVQNAGIARGAIREAIEEAIQNRFIECLHTGTPNTPGQSGSTSLYRLRWDPSDEYVTDPERFDGFFEGNGNFTYIPNAFFDVVVPNEKLSVVRVVGAIIRNTICWEARRGHRKQHVSMSLSELERRTKMHRETASLGLQEALAAGYLRRDHEGLFDPDKSLQRPATYSLRWEGDPATQRADLNLRSGEDKGTVQKSDQTVSEGRFKNPTRETVQKSDQGEFRNPTRRSVQNSDQKGFKNPTSIERTTLNNTSKQQQTEVEDVVVEGDSLRSSVLADLLDPELGGFTRSAALRLLDRYPAERIRKVLDTVSTEGARVKAALITAAVKDGNYRPAAEIEPVDEALRLFATGFYRGRTPGKASIVEPSKADLKAVKGLVESLSGRRIAGSPESWGEAFGGYAKGRESEGKRIAALSLAVKAHGDDWLQSFTVVDERVRAEKTRMARESHEKASLGAYRAYLASEQARMRESNHEAFQALEREVAEQVERIIRSPVRSERAKAIALENLNSEAGRLEKFAEFMTERSLVLSFWEWDRRMNPQGYMEVGQ